MLMPIISKASDRPAQEAAEMLITPYGLSLQLLGLTWERRAARVVKWLLSKPILLTSIVSLIISRTCMYDFQGRNKRKHNMEEKMTHPLRKKKVVKLLLAKVCIGLHIYTSEC